MISKFLILGFLLYATLGYSQAKLKYLEDNRYLIQTVYLDIDKLESYLENRYGELKKNERGLVRTTVLSLRNDTLTIIDTDSTGIQQRILFRYGKRSGRTLYIE